MESRIDYDALMQRHSRMAFVPLIVGVAGLLLSLWPAFSIVALPVSLIGWIAGLLGRRYTRKNNIPEDKKNSIGRVCGLVGALLSFLTTLLLILALITVS